MKCMCQVWVTWPNFPSTTELHLLRWIETSEVKTWTWGTAWTEVWGLIKYRLFGGTASYCVIALWSKHYIAGWLMRLWTLKSLWGFEAEDLTLKTSLNHRDWQTIFYWPILAHSLLLYIKLFPDTSYSFVYLLSMSTFVTKAQLSGCYRVFIAHHPLKHLLCDR